jgi:hypothetical protein
MEDLCPSLSLEERIERLQIHIAAVGLNLGTPLTELEVLEFERANEVQIPEDYRAFITCIGCDGDGPPYYGLESIKSKAVREYTAHMDRVFPFSRPWLWEDGEKSDEGTYEQVKDGILYLGTDGCSMDWVLVVTGPQRGQIWQHCDVAINPGDSQNVFTWSFLDWYEDWLEKFMMGEVDLPFFQLRNRQPL